MPLFPFISAYQQNDPLTYRLFVPGYSLLNLITKIRSALPLMPKEMITIENHEEANKKARHFSQICKSHFKGAAIQFCAFVVAIAIFSPLFLLLIPLPLVEITYLFGICSNQKRIVICEFYPDGEKMTCTYDAIDLF